MFIKWHGSRISSVLNRETEADHDQDFQDTHHPRKPPRREIELAIVFVERPRHTQVQQAERATDSDDVHRLEVPVQNQDVCIKHNVLYKKCSRIARVRQTPGLGEIRRIVGV